MLHRLLRAEHQGTKSLRAHGEAGLQLVEDALGTSNLAGSSTASTHVFHLAAQAGVRSSWGQEFQIYTALNVDATQRLLEACVGPAD